MIRVCAISLLIMNTRALMALFVEINLAAVVEKAQSHEVPPSAAERGWHTGSAAPISAQVVLLLLHLLLLLPLLLIPFLRPPYSALTYPPPGSPTNDGPIQGSGASEATTTPIQTVRPLDPTTRDRPQPGVRSSPARALAPVRWEPGAPPAHTRPWPPSAACRR